MKHLENYGVQELNAKELKSIEGGFWASLLLAAILITVGVLLNKHL